MVTKRGALIALAVVGAFIGIALVYLVLSAGGGLYAARRAQIYDEPARALFVSAAVQLAIVPLLGVAACAAFEVARASSPVRRGVMAWGLSILTAPVVGIVGLTVSMTMPTPDFLTVFSVLVVAAGLANGGIWVAVARARFGTSAEAGSDDRAS